jgi:large conductance mechanosensitive channel
MSMMEEFKAFAMKGNVVDLAVGVIIGGAFGKIVDSIVGDLIMPVVGAIFGGLDFSKFFIVLGNNPDKLSNLADLKKAGVATFAYGNFITILVNFLILAFIIFMMVKAMNKAKKAAEPPPAPTPEDVLLLREIRDNLKK